MHESTFQDRSYVRVKNLLRFLWLFLSHLFQIKVQPQKTGVLRKYSVIYSNVACPVEVFHENETVDPETDYFNFHDVQ